jgi:DNA-binding MarR family transcriptional regulator
VNPDSYFQLNRTIHEKGRLAIMSLLAGANDLSFTELRNTLKMTDGNLSMHIRTLQQAGYLSVTKQYLKRRPLTTCSLTSEGRASFGQYINLLEKIVMDNRPGSSGEKD